MFNWRSSSKKPSDALYKDFKINHPEVSQNQSPILQSSTAASQQAATTTADALDVPSNSRPSDTQLHDHKDADSTPRGGNDPWSFGSSGLTPSIMDPNSHSFHLFDHLAYYPPTPGGAGNNSGNANMLFDQHGQHHSNSYGSIGISTPLSMPTSEAAMNTGPHVFHDFQQTPLPSQMHQTHFSNTNPFHVSQQAFPPHQFHHHSTHHSLDFEGPNGESPIDDLGMDVGASQLHSDHSSHLLFRSQHSSTSLPQATHHPSSEKFRFHSTLNAPTAMIAHADEIPITYLNKGQAYTLNVVDTQAQPSSRPRRYRTFVRVSFQDEQQRQKPAQCWQLWKEGRGTNEAHQRGGRLQAVEYVDPSQNNAHDDPSKPRFELESSSFDGFCVRWSPLPGTVEGPISVRFNFLSTDFSHSKGVKGIPVRLCAKTELIEENDGQWPQASSAEVCYCMVKLFRDHGAERKLSNDVAHVKKTIDKLNQQIAQIESGLREFGKRKRSGSVARASLDKGPGKAMKHRRTWSMNSVASNSGRGSAEEDLHRKLVALQDRFTSTRPASVLHLRGDEGDDPDLFPVKLTGDDFVRPSTTKQESTESGTTWERTGSEAEQASSMVSPATSEDSMPVDRKDSSMQQPTPSNSLPRSDSDDWRSLPPQLAVKDSLPTIHEQGSTPSPTRVQTRSPRTGAKRASINVSGIDPNYQPPTERPIKPVACFYVMPRIEGEVPSDNFYRAVYLTRRTVRDFNLALATKCGIEPTLVIRTVRIPRGSDMQVLLDDDCVREMAEGQDMTAKFRKITHDAPLEQKREWNAGPSDVQCDGDLATLQNASTKGYELVLQY